MNAISVFVLLVVIVATLSVRREHAPIPLLFGCCYIPMTEGIEIGSASFFFYRIVLLVGLARVIMKGETVKEPLSTADKLFFVFLVWYAISSMFHEEGSLNRRLGVVLSIGASYYLARCWCRSVEGVRSMIVAIAIILIPLSIEMFQETLTGKNLFGSIFASARESVTYREGTPRAQGPFRHSILAGTVGASCFPLMVGILRQRPLIGISGALACLVIAWSSGSSGPVVALMASGVLVFAWRFRHHTRTVVWLAIGGYILLELVSTRPAYTAIVTRLGVMNGSTAHHRSRLITTTIDHFNEWWLYGTDYTRHWLPNGIGAKMGNHIDFTNYYIAFAVAGGALAVGLVIWLLIILAKSFIRLMVDSQETREGGQDLFLIWCVGCTVFSHALSASSVGYFDQSMVFFWLSVSVLATLLWQRELATEESTETEDLSAGSMEIDSRRDISAVGRRNYGGW